MTVPNAILDPKTDAIGVHYIAATEGTPPLRIFYPADIEQSERKSVGWFQETSVVDFLSGYAHMGLARHDTAAFQYLLRPFLYLSSFLIPMTWMKVPAVYENATPQAISNKLPLVIFSHGLTGTGQENIVLCAAWAKRGYVVASVHHTDGSSCQVPLAGGETKYYEHGPPFSQYDASFRPRQVLVRAQEMIATHGVLTSDTTSETLKSIQELVDPQHVVAAGFSYGAATVARTIVMDQSPFTAAIMLDGWFYIDVMKSAGVAFEFPQEAFEYREKHEDNESPLPVPSLFIDSEQFQGYTPLFKATERLAGKTPVHVIPGTGHQNFCDVIFWIRPLTLLRKLMFGTVGPADPKEAYTDIIRQSGDFLDQTTGKASG